VGTPETFEDVVAGAAAYADEARKARQTVFAGQPGEPETTERLLAKVYGTERAASLMALTPPF
jgi:hypothetical protein